MRDEMRKEPWRHVDRLRKELVGATDRATAIVIASYLDAMLEQVLRNFMVNRAEGVKSLFDHRGPLSAFSGKIDVALSLGLVSGQEAEWLHQIREIRNKFAHNLGGLNFTNQSVADKCNHLILPHGLTAIHEVFEGEDDAKIVRLLESMPISGGRERFVMVSLFLIQALSVRSMSADRDRCEEAKTYSSDYLPTEHVIEMCEGWIAEFEYVTKSDSVSEEDRERARSYVIEQRQELNLQTAILNGMKEAAAAGETMFTIIPRGTAARRTRL